VLATALWRLVMSWCWVSRYNYHAELIAPAWLRHLLSSCLTHYQDLFLHHPSGCQTEVECAFGCLKKNQNQKMPFFATKLMADLHFFAMNYLPMIFSPVFARQRRRDGRKLGVRSQTGTFLAMRTRKIPLGGMLYARISSLCLLCRDPDYLLL